MPAEQSLSREISKLSKSIDELARNVGGGKGKWVGGLAAGRAGLGAGTGAGTGAGLATGALVGGANLGLKKLASLGAVVGGAGAAITGIEGGIASIRGGGDFAQGVGRGLNAAFAKIPILGEALGFSRSTRVVNRTEAGIRSAGQRVARFAGPDAISPEVLKFVAARKAREAENVERFNERASAAAIDAAATLALKSGIEQLGQTLQSLFGGAFAVGQHT